MMVLFFLFIHYLQAQFDISGVILDSASREPLSKASVFCQNTTLGTLTNKEGAFNLSSNQAVTTWSSVIPAITLRRSG